jgi:HSP20 family molecular chaperone IbpA
MKNGFHEEVEYDFELPDFRKEDIKVAIKNNILFIKADREFSQKKEKKSSHFEKRSKQAFTHSENLPKVNAKEMRWFFKGGLLTIKVPKMS